VAGADDGDIATGNGPGERVKGEHTMSASTLLSTRLFAIILAVATDRRIQLTAALTVALVVTYLTHGSASAGGRFP
jgi:hypothetical protein